MTSVYGIPYDQHEPYLEIIGKANDAFGEAGIPGTYLVDTFPMLQYVPAWFPWAGFKRKAAYERGIVGQMVDKPLGFVKENMVISLRIIC